MYRLFEQFQPDNTVRGQLYNGFRILGSKVHAGFLDPLAELPVLLAQCGQRPVQIMFGNVPYGAFGAFSVRPECPQHQRAGNEVVRPVAPCDDVFPEEAVIGHFNPCPVRIDPINHLPV